MKSDFFLFYFTYFLCLTNICDRVVWPEYRLRSSADNKKISVNTIASLSGGRFHLDVVFCSPLDFHGQTGGIG